MKVAVTVDAQEQQNLEAEGRVRLPSTHTPAAAIAVAALGVAAQAVTANR